ncbi:hypothetical protein WKR88_24265 [Trinickia caryophylli]|uniref:Uncharacterized protein n=1 Tax=Trinickia caryophylli TaxID=28094 RepID=A0A1X7E8F4_TRICW|nr:hypothetical protein [Trinickia caryophylli]PMS13027.1 hypothetical protein C0Z17_07015 [Trinickia caryophylli]TRX14790.1 hypothetical protein FNF07_26495 [Trinickia caryophylli]WQE14635.1 hypothetical protein U0034_28685 [Trinickia caryophylli]SMF29503.1 hypothetical protein SAMN06295900_10561 [Trinickia caryophylli]GLU31946.1 hypothetical protein Busp01_17880 [Trinickia caryophylli]
MKYIKKSAIVEAIRYDQPGRHPLVDAFEGGWRIPTPDGWRSVDLGDWIVTDSSGVSWPMSDAMFMQMYEPCEAGD